MAFPEIGLEAVFRNAAFNRAVSSYLHDLGRIERQTDLTASGIGTQFASLGSAVWRVAGITAAAVAAMATALGGALIAFGADATKTAISFETAFAGVVKTVDGLTSGFGVLNEAGLKLKAGFMQLSETVPISAEQLMRIGELGGQLGIGKEDILEFTSVVADLGVTTDLSTEAASLGIARFMAVMGTARDDVRRVGSAIVDLGNNFATTEPQILEFAQRIAGAGRIAGLTEANVLAIGAAMASVGVLAEAGGTAVQKMLININTAVAQSNESLTVFADTAGLTATEFAELWERDAGVAFELFVRGLSEQGAAAIQTLSELGLEDARLVRSFLSLAGAGDLLSRTMEHSRTAWKENVALTYEAQQRYATTASQLQMLRNQWRNVKTDIGAAFLPALRSIVDVFSELIKTHGPQLIAIFRDKISPAIARVAQAFGQLVSSDVAGALTTMFGPEVTARIQEIAGAIGDFTDRVVAFVREHSEEFKGALLGIGAVLAAAAIASVIASIAGALATLLSPIGLIITAAALLGAAWAGNWLGIRDILTAFWENTAKPILGALIDWLKVNIPIAIEAVSQFWTNTLLPAIQAVWLFISKKLIPTLVHIAVSIFETVKAGIQTLSDFWTSVLLPAIKGVWDFISTYIIPLFESLGGVVIAALGLAVRVLASIWETQLLPPLEMVWEFLRDKVGPIFEWIAEKVLEGVGIQIKALVDIWNTLLQPALQQMWEFVKEKLGPVLEWLANTVLNSVRASFNAVKDAIQWVIDKANAFRDTLNNIRLPAWLTPGSPTPFELGLRGIAQAMHELTAQELPQMRVSLDASAFDQGLKALTMQMPAAPQMSSPALMSSQAREYHLHINTSAASEPILSDFRMMEAFAL